MADRPPPPTRPRRSRRQRQVLTVGIGLTVVLFTIAVGGAYGLWSFGRIKRFDLDLSGGAKNGPKNFLIVGSDSRAKVGKDTPNAGAFGPDEGGQRSDTISVLRIDPRHEGAQLLSLPRDLWLPIADTGKPQRINTAFSRGKQVLIDTIEGQLGIRINHYVEVDFSGFQDLVEAIGGVPVWFDRAMRDRNSGLDVQHPGCVTLDGPQALAFARARHLEYMRDGEWQSDPTADLGRITRQQYLMRRAIDRARTRGLSHPLALKRLIDAGASHVSMDSGLSPGDLFDLGRRYSQFSGRQLVTYTLPVNLFTTAGGAGVVKLDDRTAPAVLDHFRDRPLARPDDGQGREADVSVRVVNGAAIAHHAANVAGALQGAGFEIDSIGNIGDERLSREPYTRILFNPADLRGADLLDRHLTNGAVLVPSTGIRGGVLELVTGPDLTGVRATALKAAVRPAAAPDVTTTTAASPRSPTGSGAGPSTTTTTAPVGFVPADPPPDERC